MALGGL